MTSPVLYIFSGLPGSGKSTLAQELAKQTGAMFIRIDTVEQGLRDLCQYKVEGEGYRLSYRIAHDNLQLGLSVIADSCNPIPLTREEWQQIALDSGACYVNINILCSDKAEHQSRVEQRKSSIRNLTLPTWQQVVAREQHDWDTPVVQIDTAGKSVQSCCDEMIDKLSRYLR